MKSKNSIYGFPIAVPLLVAVFMATGCQSDYRTISVMKSSPQNPVTWQVQSARANNVLSGRDFNSKNTFINPYAYNPNNLKVQGGWITNFPFLTTNFANNASLYFLASSPSNVTGL